MAPRGVLAICWVAAAISIASSAAAHDRSASRARVVVSGERARIDLALSDLDRSALAHAGIDGRDELAAHLISSVALSSDRAWCAAEARSFRDLASTEGTSRWEWRVRCDGTPARLRALPVPSRPSHVCFARVTPAGSTEIVAQDHVLSEIAPEVELRAAPTSRVEAFSRFVPIGVEHILSGLDHLVFLLMLLLAAGSLRHAAILATGFTLGHSVTLAAAALGTVTPEPRVVEALIGFSIAVVAVDAVRPAAVSQKGLSLSRHLWLAAGFGLLHGLGFAGALREVGLPPDRAVVALLGFNVGVELGQIAIVLAIWPLLAWSRRVDARRTLILELCAATGACAGTFWFVSRLFG
jgi:hypothetical protein